MRVMFFILVMVTLQNMAKAADNSVTIERCETLAEIIMNETDTADNDLNVIEMDTLECNELGDFFN